MAVTWAPEVKETILMYFWEALSISIDKAVKETMYLIAWGKVWGNPSQPHKNTLIVIVEAALTVQEKD